MQPIPSSYYNLFYPITKHWNSVNTLEVKVEGGQRVSINNSSWKNWPIEMNCITSEAKVTVKWKFSDIIAVKEQRI